MSIQKVNLENFQSHAASLLEFDPGINVIVGDSDSGKTAIIRALNWVLMNRPTGEAFRRNGSEKTVVTVATSDGTISRVRSDRDNFYLNGAGEKLSAIGTSVPEPVLKLLKMDPNLNIQRQLDAPFLLSCSAGEVAQRLNAVVGLDDIDIGLSNAARRVRKNQTAYEDAVKRCGELSEQTGSFAYLDQMEQDVEEVEQWFGKLLENRAQEEVLKALHADIATHESSLRRLPDVDQMWIGILQCEERLQHYNIVDGEVLALSGCVDEIRRVLVALKALTDVSGMLVRIEEVEGILRHLKEAGRLFRCGTDMLHEERMVRRDLQMVSQDLVEQEGQFHKQMLGTCPLCGRKSQK